MMKNIKPRLSWLIRELGLAGDVLGILNYLGKLNVKGPGKNPYVVMKNHADPTAVFNNFDIIQMAYQVLSVLS